MPSASCPLLAAGSNVSTRYNFSNLSKFKLRRLSTSGSTSCEPSRGPMKGNNHIDTMASIKLIKVPCQKDPIYSTTFKVLFTYIVFLFCFNHYVLKLSY